MPDPRDVQAMFGRIAGRYDFLNRVLSMGIDRRWRALTVRLAGDVRGRRVLDVACGTGDLSAEFAQHGAHVLGVDFTPEMVRQAPGKLRGTPSPHAFAQGDAMRLPVRSDSVDVASIAFGIRNLADPDAGLREFERVLVEGGRLMVLEFTPPPRGVLGAIYRFYFARLLPWIGGLVSGDFEAYRYLPRTVQAWPEPAQFQARMEQAGFEDCGYRLLTCGIACLHWGTRAKRRATP